jgi:hypothetical protein
LPEVLLLLLCATLSGVEDFVEINLWGRERLDFLRRLLPFEPLRATIEAGRVETDRGFARRR